MKNPSVLIQLDSIWRVLGSVPSQVARSNTNAIGGKKKDEWGVAPLASACLFAC